MLRWRKSLERFVRTEDGPTTVEYAVILALILVACVASIQALGGSVNAVYANKSLNDAAGS
jgi:pilus assembly protein Flp/PilA